MLLRDIVKASGNEKPRELHIWDMFAPARRISPHLSTTSRGQDGPGATITQSSPRRPELVQNGSGAGELDPWARLGPTTISRSTLPAPPDLDFLTNGLAEARRTTQACRALGDSLPHIPASSLRVALPHWPRGMKCRTSMGQYRSSHRSHAARRCLRSVYIRLRSHLWRIRVNQLC